MLSDLTTTHWILITLVALIGMAEIAHIVLRLIHSRWIGKRLDAHKEWMEILSSFASSNGTSIGAIFGTLEKLTALLAHENELSEKRALIVDALLRILVDEEAEEKHETTTLLEKIRDISERNPEGRYLRVLERLRIHAVAIQDCREKGRVAAARLAQHTSGDSEEPGETDVERTDGVGEQSCEPVAAGRDGECSEGVEDVGRATQSTN